MYIVEVYKIACGQELFLSHEVVSLSHSSNTVDPNQIYKVVITPRNNVDGARNGTSVKIEGGYD